MLSKIGGVNWSCSNIPPAKLPPTEIEMSGL